jgi:hypothetical protein
MLNGGNLEGIMKLHMQSTYWVEPVILKTGVTHPTWDLSARRKNY